jgi:hypothetical protein
MWANDPIHSSVAAAESLYFKLHCYLFGYLCSGNHERFGSAARNSRLHRTGTQWGQWWDSVYLCDYAAQPLWMSLDNGVERMWGRRSDCPEHAFSNNGCRHPRVLKPHREAEI